MAAAASVEKIREAQRAKGPANILAIGTANPSNIIDQAEYPDFYFRITNCDHMTLLKDKFKRMCERSMIKKRYVHLTEEILKQNQNMCKLSEPSFNVRQDIVVEEIPKLGKEAAAKAIKEWGRPKSDITHLIFCSTVGVDMPGADYQLIKLLGLNSSIKRFMLYHQGCLAGGTVLRLAKDLAENNKGARVLIVSAELLTVSAFHSPSDTELDSLVSQAIFGDGASSVIVGADPDTSVERPLFQLVFAMETIIPDSDGAIESHPREVGLTVKLSENVPNLIANNIEEILVKAFSPIGINDWNSIFWISHPGGSAILNQIEAKLGLKQHKLRASKHVLSEYGNMSSASVLFILDEMRKKSVEEGKATSGEGLEWGVLSSFGPGITAETVVLHSIPVSKVSSEATN